MTIETTPLLTEAEARRLTLRIGLLLDSAAGVLDNLSAAIREARDRRADLALGYESWAEYATAEFGDRTAGLAPAIRRELVATLSVEVDGSPALSTPQIAPALGVNQSTVVRDRQAMQPAYPAAAVSDESPVFLDATTPSEVATELPPGRDGKDQAAVVRDVQVLHRATPAPQTPQGAGLCSTDGAVFPPAAVESEAAVSLGVQPRDPETAVPDGALTPPTPRPAVLGLDGKTYTRPEPKPRPVDPRKGTDLYALRMAIIPALSAWTDQWSTKSLLDDSVTAEEAAQLLRDLSRSTPVLSQIRRLLTSRTEPTK